ncbi:MAG: DMT family transporter [Pseudorhizobium sp.]
MSAAEPNFYQSRFGVFGLATLCCLLWGSAYPAIKSGYALLAIAPNDIASQVLFAGSRFVLAGIMLLAAAVAMRKPVFTLGVRSARQVALLGLTQTAAQYVFFYIGLAHATGVKSSIMNATGVFFSVALAHFIYADDRLTVPKALGCLIGFFGVVIVNLGDGGGQLTFDFTLLGEGFVAIAAFLLAAASIYGKRVSSSVDPLVMTGWQLLIGGVALTAAGMAFGGQMERLELMSGGLLLYMALLSAAAFGIWSLLLKHNAVGMIAAFNFLVPIFGVVLSSIFLGESLMQWANLVALVLVSIGIWLVTRSSAALQPSPPK